MSSATLPLSSGGRPTANDRLKRSFGSRFWGSLLAASLVHFAVLALWPEMRAGDVSVDSRELQTVELPPEVKIPPPPEEIARPAVPVLSPDVSVDPELTIPPATFSDNPVESLPEPPRGTGVDVSESPVWTPREVDPDLKNRPEYLRVLQRRYPPMLKDAGIGGTVVLWVFIDETGAVKNTRVIQGSGYEELDRVARELMQEVARFSPALNRDQRVPVWIQIPVTFQAR